MEMEPPTSTTIPPGMSNAKAVTQRVTVTNSMLGQKNLVLKLKIGFTSNGQKIEHMGTCSGFPAGQY
jgi:AP-1 complex subunit gamma-1